ncbi:MAG: alpha-L-arabinofuranosidase [Phycisphaerae bacterium]|nr:alpha-L-arabinofuranosidase [Phycisphaerae bacterium]
MKINQIFRAAVLMSTAAIASAQSTITISADQPGTPIAPTMWGIFFEDINFGADGGLYAELVKNRSFEFDNPMMGWSLILSADSDGQTAVVVKEPVDEKNPHYLKMSASRGQPFGIANEGFRGMGIRQGRSYWFSVFARNIGSPAVSLRIEVASGTEKLMEGRIENITGDWKNYTCKMEARATEPKAHLEIFMDSFGTVDLDMISLFPADSAQMADRPIPGLREDIVAMLADLKPGFLRFPGGCIVEGVTLSNRYQWKNTIGDINQRKTIINRWNTEFKHRLTPDYYQSFGLGFFEYFLLCEKIGAEPMPIINCGMACQFNTGETAAVDKLGPYVQDALDLIEFANGPADSPWGRKRADMGHPKPFNMKFLGVGNEQWGPQYIERYKVFVKAIKEKYPDIKLIGATGSDPAIFPNGPKEVEYLWQELRRLNADIVDEHFYRPPDWFIQNAARYDAYKRSGPRIFIGEYAAISQNVGSPNNRNNLAGALAEAAFMTGLERNADLVRMAAYAPLTAHVDAWQWKPNLIWFDNLSVYGTPSYYVQKLFSNYRGDALLPAECRQAQTLFVSAVRSGKSIILKAVNPSSKSVAADINLKGITSVSSAQSVILTGLPQDENTIDQPAKVLPVNEPVNVQGPAFEYLFKPYSMTVLQLTVQ